MGPKLTVTEDLGRGPRDAAGVGVDAVADELAAAADVVDGVLEDLDAAAGFHDCVCMCVSAISHS